MSRSLTSGLTIVVVTLALLLGGAGFGIAISGRFTPAPETSTVTSSITTTATSTTTNSSSPFVLTLVVAIHNLFNSSAGEQPAFYVLGQQGLQSSANIAVPAHRLIKLVIINYDDGNATMAQSGVNTVSGTRGNTVFVASNDNVNSTQGPTGIVIRGGQTISSVSPQVLAHTFSVPSIGLNIPMPVSSTIVGYFTINQPGTYFWFCMTLCGPAAMSTPGWMTGSLVAS